MWIIDRELYLPREWTDDPERLREAGVPGTVSFATKGELAKIVLFRDAEHGLHGLIAAEEQQCEDADGQNGIALGHQELQPINGGVICLLK